MIQNRGCPCGRRCCLHGVTFNAQYLRRNRVARAIETAGLLALGLAGIVGLVLSYHR